MRRAPLLCLLLTACATPQRPPTTAPARVRMERLAQRHFLHGEATPTERAELVGLLDLHGRGAEAALLEAPDDPARAERAWFAGPRAAPFTTPEAAQAGLPPATARLEDDPRAIRTLWLLAHAARLDPRLLRDLAGRWRADWPASGEARIALAMSEAQLAPADAPVDLFAWAQARPLDVAAIRAADAAWRPPADLADRPRWAAVRVLASWRAGAFDVLTSHVPRQGPTVTTLRRLPFVPTATDRVIGRLSVRAWGPALAPREGAPTPSAGPDGWTATLTGAPALRVDDWAPADGPRWQPTDAPAPAPRRARLRWRLTPTAAGWRGTLTAWGLPPQVDALLALHPRLTVGSLRSLPLRDGLPGWRAQVSFDGSPERSLLDDTQIEALGGPIATRTLAEATERRGELRLAPAAVEIALSTPARWAAPAEPRDAGGWAQRLALSDPQTIRRSWRRPAIDWPAGLFAQRRVGAQALEAQLQAFVGAHAPDSIRGLLGAPAPDEEN